jgi:hypothetical protein
VRTLGPSSVCSCHCQKTLNPVQCSPCAFPFWCSFSGSTAPCAPCGARVPRCSSESPSVQCTPVRLSSLVPLLWEHGAVRFVVTHGSPCITCDLW